MAFVAHKVIFLKRDLVVVYGQGFFKWAIPGLFFNCFRLFKQTLIFLQQIYVKNVQSVYNTGI